MLSVSPNRWWLPGLLLFLLSSAQAELTLSAVFSDHMVLQRNLSCPVWGWDEPGTRVTVTFDSQQHETVAGLDGRWSVSLDPMDANAEPESLIITGTSRKVITDILIGEVWLCSGQSNMAFKLPSDYHGDLAMLAAANDQIRFIELPTVGTQSPQTSFRGAWAVANPETVRRISAVGYYFGDYLQRTLHVPIGLIDNSWGGSAADAWIDRRVLEAAPRFDELIRETVERETFFATSEATESFAQDLAAWRAKTEAGEFTGRKPRSPESWLQGNKRVGNLFNGMLHPLIGYGIKGTIWYQGEANVGRAAQYADLFPFLISNWREAWGQGDFSFYWAQLADFQMETSAPHGSFWAELRDSQTKALQLPHTGQAVIIDLGEGRDIHPRNKHAVGARLARIALAQDYGFDLPYRSPIYRDHRTADGKVLVSLNCFGSKLRAFDTETVHGFAICGEDRKWHWAEAEITGDDTIEVWSADVREPIAVRYAWANNPVCNLFAATGLPVTPFRTDDFPLLTAGRESPPSVLPHP